MVLAEKLNELNIKFNGKVYVLGQRSFEILQDKGLDLVFFPEANSADEMLPRIPAEELKNKHYLFIRGDKSLRTIPDFLAKFATFEETVVYRNRQIPLGIAKIKEIKQIFDRSEIAAVCFFSPSGAESFIKQFGKDVLEIEKIAVIGNTTAHFFAKQDLAVDFISNRSTAEGFANELIKFLESNELN